MAVVIKPKGISLKAANEAEARWKNVAKPLNSLGSFEKMIVKIASVQGTPDIDISKRCALVFCADHGVVAQGVSQSGSEVTSLVAKSICMGESNINVLAKCAGADVFAIDMGMKTPLDCRQMINMSHGRGTRDFTVEPAMSLEQAENAIGCGMDAVQVLAGNGYTLIATGEMGIGNTTATAALACALTGESAQTMVCRGSGLSDKGLEAKVKAVKTALELHKDRFGDPIGALACVGGFELAGMVGAFLGAAQCGVTIVIDGVISAVCALTAARICPEATNYMLPSHMSASAAAAPILNELGLKPVIYADMALGEGTGAVMLFPLLDMAKRLYDSAHTFDSLGMDAYTPQ